MEIRERIESCLNDLDARRRRMADFETRVRALMETLKRDTSSPSTVREILEVLSSAIENYSEIDGSCRAMISALSEIGRNQERIEDGRRKIISGVEKILGHLSQMETLAKQSMIEPKAAAAASTAGAPEAPARPKKILLIRLRPQGEQMEEIAGERKAETSERGEGPSREENRLEDLLRADDDLDATVH